MVLPKLYGRYCSLNRIEQNNVEFINWLYKIPKRIIIVFLDDEINSEMGKSKTYKHLRRENSLKSKYSPLKNIINAEYSIITQSEFNKEFLYKIQN